MNYNINPYQSAGDIKFNLSINEVIKLLGDKYDVTELDIYNGKQFYYPNLALKIIFDNNKKVNGIFFYNENAKFHQVLYEGSNLFELNYLSIKEKLKNYRFLEDTESIVIIDLGISFYFQEAKEDNPFPEEVGVFRADLKEFYLNSYKI